MVLSNLQKRGCEGATREDRMNEPSLMLFMPTPIIFMPTPMLCAVTSFIALDVYFPYFHRIFTAATWKMTESRRLLRYVDF